MCGGRANLSSVGVTCSHLGYIDMGTPRFWPPTCGVTPHFLKGLEASRFRARFQGPERDYVQVCNCMLFGSGPRWTIVYFSKQQLFSIEHTCMKKIEILTWQKS